MDNVKRKESGASEVIGAVLLVSLVVIGGAVIAAFTFGQPTPKEVPHVNFGVSLDNKTDILTLHHTGGDTLQAGEYNVTVFYTDGSTYKAPSAETSVTWSSDQNLNITHVTKAVGDVVLSYIDGAGGETVLRRVPFEDHSLRGVISGYKYNVTGGHRVPWTAGDPAVTINILKKEGSTYTGVYSHRVDANGFYSYMLPFDVWGVYRVEEVVPAGWEAVSPPHGSRQVDVTTSSPNKQVDFENRLIPVVTTRTTRPTETTMQTVATTATTAIPTVSISGIKYKVNETGVVQGIPPVVTITLDLISPRIIAGYVFPMTTSTDPVTGAYSFTVPDVPATYRLTESGLDVKTWYVYSPVGGVIDGVVPGGTGYNFMNQLVAPNGIVMYLNKTVEPGCQGGHVVDGTYLQGDARGGDKVIFTINGKKQTYTFKNNEQFRFTIAGNQTSGEMKIEHDALTQLSFNVTFQVRDSRTEQWYTPNGYEGVHKPTVVSITAINKNLVNEESTLSYKYPICAPSDTTLRLNGQVWCDTRDPPGNDAYMWFTDLHVVHDNRYGEGLNTMWIFLEPKYNYILVQGVCRSP